MRILKFSFALSLLAGFSLAIASPQPEEVEAQGQRKALRRIINTKLQHVHDAMENFHDKIVHSDSTTTGIIIVEDQATAVRRTFQDGKQAIEDGGPRLSRMKGRADVNWHILEIHGIIEFRVIASILQKNDAQRSSEWDEAMTKILKDQQWEAIQFFSVILDKWPFWFKKGMRKRMRRLEGIYDHAVSRLEELRLAHLQDD